MKDPVVFHCEIKIIHPRRQPKTIYTQVWVERSDYSYMKEFVYANAQDVIEEGL